jgi:uncharacterized protein YggE
MDSYSDADLQKLIDKRIKSYMVGDHGRLIVEETILIEVKASSAVLHVTVKGSSYFAADEAMKKAKEVSALLDALRELGIPEHEIRLKNVVAETESGILTKTSSARYNLSIKVRDMEKLSDTLGIVTGGKNVQLHKLDWLFLEDREVKLDCIRRAFAAVKQTAESIVVALGASISAINDCSYTEFTVTEQDYGPRAIGTGAEMMSKMNTVRQYEVATPGPELPAQQWQRQGVRAKVVFQVRMNAATDAADS